MPVQPCNDFVPDLEGKLSLEPREDWEVGFFLRFPCVVRETNRNVVEAFPGMCLLNLGLDFSRQSPHKQRPVFFVLPESQ